MASYSSHVLNSELIVCHSNGKKFGNQMCSEQVVPSLYFVMVLCYKLVLYNCLFTSIFNNRVQLLLVSTVQYLLVRGLYRSFNQMFGIQITIVLDIFSSLVISLGSCLDMEIQLSFLYLDTAKPFLNVCNIFFCLKDFFVWSGRGHFKQKKVLLHFVGRIRKQQNKPKFGHKSQILCNFIWESGDIC